MPMKLSSATDTANPVIVPGCCDGSRWIGIGPPVTYPDVDTAANDLQHLMTTTGGGALGERMGITIIEAAPERVVATMPVQGNTQPYGLLHGGASCVLAETIGSIGAVLHGLTMDRPFAVGVDINATHHKGVRSGTVTGVGTPLHRGRTAVTYDIVITDDDGDRVCTARLTCLLRGA
jgi:1,4-dihydroxy-2-naphthoyl-CoA hydrolase